MQINKDIRITDDSYYNLPLDDVAKNAIYSTDEIVVGRWTNGKPIYRRVFTFSAEKREPRDIISVTIANMDEPIGYSGYWIDTYFGNNRNPLDHGGAYNASYESSFQWRKNTANICFDSGTARGVTGKMILEYTKTTD